MAGWKAWTRETLDIADMQELLQDQVVQRYASRAARTADGPAVLETGMASYLEDEGFLELVVAGAWVAPYSRGMIDHNATTSSYVSDGTTATQRVVGGLNRVVTLRTGRAYVVTTRGRFATSVAPSVSHLLTKIKRAGTPIDTDLTVASSRLDLAATTRSQDVTSEGEFAVSVTDSHTLSPFLQTNTGVLTLANDSRGRVSVSVEDRGIAPAGILTL